MKLFAKKPCSFNGRKFFIGDEIPESYVLDPKAQKSMGIIEVVEGESGNAAPGEGGPLLPPSSTLEKAYTESTLNRMKVDELLSVAKDAGIEVDEEMKKKDIIRLLLKK